MTPRRKKHIQRVSGVLFFLYLAVLIYFLFFADEYGRTPSVEMRYNLVPFVEIRRFLVYRKVLGEEAQERTAFEVSISALEEPTEEAEAPSADEAYPFFAP